MSDGCTGFWLAELIWTINDCCAVHDNGGTDGLLLDCLTANGVPAVLAALGIVLMVCLRPVYHWIKPWLDPVTIKIRSLFQSPKN